MLNSSSLRIYAHCSKHLTIWKVFNWFEFLFYLTISSQTKYSTFGRTIWGQAFDLQSKGVEGNWWSPDGADSQWSFYIVEIQSERCVIRPCISYRLNTSSVRAQSVSYCRPQPLKNCQNRREPSMNWLSDNVNHTKYSQGHWPTSRQRNVCGLFTRLRRWVCTLANCACEYVLTRQIVLAHRVCRTLRARGSITRSAAVAVMGRAADAVMGNN